MFLTNSPESRHPKRTWVSWEWTKMTILSSWVTLKHTDGDIVPLTGSPSCGFVHMFHWLINRQQITFIHIRKLYYSRVMFINIMNAGSFSTQCWVRGRRNRWVIKLTYAFVTHCWVKYKPFINQLFWLSGWVCPFLHQHFVKIYPNIFVKGWSDGISLL